MTKIAHRTIQPCEAPRCDIDTNKRYQHKGVVVVACSPKHAAAALALAHVRLLRHRQALPAAA